MNKKKLYIIVGVVLAVIIAGALIVYAAWPTILFNTSPDKYVKYALDNTMKDLTILEDSKKSAELVKKIYATLSAYDFGFALNNVEISGFSGTEILAGLGVDVSLIVDRDHEKAGLDVKLKKSTTPIISAKGYVSNHDFGGVVPELYDRYIVADTKDFAYNWNNSILGSNFEIDERIDIDNMYNIIFPKPAASDEKTIYDKISDIVLPVADKLTYAGKGTIATPYNGDTQNLKSINITVKKEDIKQIVNQVIDLYEFDEVDAMLSESGDYLDIDLIYRTIDQYKNYLENAQLNKDLVITLYFNKNKIVKVDTEFEVIGVENIAFAVSTDMQIADKVIESTAELRAFIPGEDGSLFNGSWYVVCEQNSPENNMSMNMTLDSPNVFDAEINMECAYGFDEKNTSVYTYINKLNIDVNYGEEYFTADAKLNFACESGIGKGVVVPDDSVNITEASQAEVFGIYTEVLSNLSEIAKLVNLGGIF